MKFVLTALTLAGFVLATAPSARVHAAAPAKAGKTEAVAPMVFSSPQKEGTKATCPITGDQFVIAKDTVHAEYKGKHVYFCCPGCKTAFDKDPEKYTK
jgi:xanthine dehydrogenase accessory factor